MDNLIVAEWPSIERVWEAWRTAPAYRAHPILYAILLSSPDFYPLTNAPPDLPMLDSEVGYDAAKNRRIVLVAED